MKPLYLIFILFFPFSAISQAPQWVHFAPGYFGNAVFGMAAGDDLWFAQSGGVLLRAGMDGKIVESIDPFSIQETVEGVVTGEARVCMADESTVVFAWGHVVGKYDGQQIQKWDVQDYAQLNSNIYSLFVDRDQNIWVSNQSGLHKFDGISWQNVSQLYPSGAVMLTGIGSITQDDDDIIWVGNFYGLFSLDGNTLTRYSSDNVPAFHGNQADHVIARNGKIYFQNNDQLGILENGVFTFHNLQLSPELFLEASNISFDADGNLWMCFRKDQRWVARFDGNTLTRMPDAGPADEDYRYIQCAPGGEIFLAATRQIYQWNGQGWDPTSESADYPIYSHPSGTSQFTASGNAMYRQSRHLVKFAENEFAEILDTFSGGSLNQTFWTQCADGQQGIWAYATEPGTILHYDGNTITQSVPYNGVVELTADTGGYFWVLAVDSTFNQSDLHRRGPDGQLDATLNFSDFNAPFLVSDILKLECINGSLWVMGNNNWLWELHDGQTDLRWNDRIAWFTSGDHESSIFINQHGDTLVRYRDAIAETLQAPTTPGFFRPMGSDSSGNIFGTANGDLVLQDGSAWVSYRAHNLPIAHYNSSAACDPKGNLWLSTQLNGIFIFNPQGVDWNFGWPDPPVVCDGEKPFAWPNPFTEQFSICLKIDESSPVQISLFDGSGRLIAGYDYGNLTSGQHQLQVPVLHLPKGMYWARIYHSGQMDVVRAVKQD